VKESNLSIARTCAEKPMPDTTEEPIPPSWTKLSEKAVELGDIVALHKPFEGRHGKVVKEVDTFRIELRLETGASLSVHRDDVTIVYTDKA